MKGQFGLIVYLVIVFQAQQLEPIQEQEYNFIYREKLRQKSRNTIEKFMKQTNINDLEILQIVDSEEQLHGWVSHLVVLVNKQNQSVVFKICNQIKTRNLDYGFVISIKQNCLDKVNSLQGLKQLIKDPQMVVLKNEDMNNKQLSKSFIQIKQKFINKKNSTIIKNQNGIIELNGLKINTQNRIASSQEKQEKLQSDKVQKLYQTVEKQQKELDFLMKILTKKMGIQTNYYAGQDQDKIKILSDNQKFKNQEDSNQEENEQDFDYYHFKDRQILTRQLKQQILNYNSIEAQKPTIQDD